MRPTFQLQKKINQNSHLFFKSQILNLLSRNVYANKTNNEKEYENKIMKLHFQYLIPNCNNEIGVCLLSSVNNILYKL